MGGNWFEPMGKRVPRKIWLGCQMSMGLLVGGNHTSSRSTTLTHLKYLILSWKTKNGLEVLEMESDSRALDEACCTESFHACTGRNCGFIDANGPRGLMGKNLLQSNAKSLCVGERSASAVLALRHLGFFNAYGVDMHPFFSLFKRRFVYELNFEDNHFDFVFSEDLDRLLVPALLVLEIERVLRPGGTGAILVGTRIRSATSVASFLNSSDVVHVCAIGSFTLVIFKKRLEGFASFERFHLPANCPSIANNQPFIKYIEPLGPFHHELSYLPEFLNISSRNKLVYINVGVGEYAKASIAKMSKPYCADHHAAFKSLAGDNTASDITDDEFYSAPMDDEGFDFVRWFKETVSDGDFVVLMMKAKPVELNILVELFETGAICRVDELFLQCLDSADCKNLLKSLRKSGVYVHQWLGD
ncbi:hypothetical protein DH2020_000165 [Rehmannia glutinosa]|uniref:Methyltransferase type 11 domain-containing protein n=1 Tax=Rehmannia glutinosa TaxID=99300 RepID=A0ABR0XVY9_REHGL